MPRLRIATLPRKPAASAAKNTSYKIGIDALAATYGRKKVAKRAEDQPFKLPAFPPEAMPPKGRGMAMDETPLSSVTSWAAAQAISSSWSEGLQFLGYTYLSELAQRAEYRVMSEVIAEEMTRKWIRFQGKGDDDKSDKISELKDYLDDMKLQAIFHKVALTDGLMGRAHIYIDTGQSSTPDEMQTPIGNGRDDVSKSKVGKGKLRGFKVVEPLWAYPLTYNSNDPLADDWYRPETWYVMARAIHRSRFLTFVGRPVPDMLKPAYAFGGLSLSQMAKPYVDNWLRTRQSVSDLIHSFTVFKLGTDLSALLMDQGDQLFRRMELFNNLRDNNNLFLHDKETEEFNNVSAPLGTLDTLLNKSQEQMAAVCRIPLVKLLGISPGGLNACLTGDALIETDQGYVPIRDVRVGQKVMTREGWAPVANAGCTGYATELIEIKAGETVVLCTANHRIWLPSISAFVPAENVRPGDRLLSRGAIAGQSMASRSRTVADFGGIMEMATTPHQRPIRENPCFIEKFGEFTTDLLRRAITSITSIEIAQTISSTISKYMKPQLMRDCMAWPSGSLFENHPNVSASVATAGIGSWRKNLLKLNFAVVGAGSLIGGEVNHRKLSPVRSVFALCAAYLSRRSAMMQNIVRENAQVQAKTAPRICPTTIKRTVTNGLNTPNSEIPTAVLSVRRVIANEFVYDIQIAPGFLPEFFANGICVHNSSEGEIVTFYDTISAQQERLFRPHLTTCIDFAQISLWGEVDPDIVYVFEPLRALSRKEEAEVRKTDAETGQILVTGGVVSQEEERIRVASDPDMPYQGLDPNDVPDLQEEEEEGLAIKGAGGAEKAILEGAGGEEPGAGGDKPNEGSDKLKESSDKPKKENDKEAAKDGVVPFDVSGDEFKETDHPRKDDGKFGSGGGSSSKGGAGSNEGAEAAAGTEDKPRVPPKKMSAKAAERIKSASTWLKTTAVEKVMTGDNVKSAAAVAIKSALYHGLQFDDAMMGVVEDYIHLQVKHVAETASVTRGVMRDTMLSVVNALINVRKGKPVAKDSEGGDTILALLEKMKAALDGMDVSEEGETAKDIDPKPPTSVLSKIGQMLNSDTKGPSKSAK